MTRLLCLPTFHGYDRAWFVSDITTGVLVVMVESDERQDRLSHEWCVHHVM